MPSHAEFEFSDLMADVIITNCSIVNVLTKEIHAGDIAVKQGVIIGIGEVESLKDTSTRTIDVQGGFAAPGFIDAHVHFESSMVTLTHFARCVLKHGTTSIIIDPHEIANVLGVPGVECVLKEAERLPLHVFVMVPSCVPATEHETSGARITPLNAERLFEHSMVLGLGEVMDYPDVIERKPERIQFINAALQRGLRVDGHCPGLRREGLWKYMLAGITSDHEPLEPEEALEKARLGMKVMLREGSASKDLHFLPHLLKEGVSLEDFLLASDDTNPHDLQQGHIDGMLRKAMRLGVEPVDAICMCTINTARHYRLDETLGSISIGRRADLVVMESLEDIRIKHVLIGGTPLDTSSINPPEYPPPLFQTVKCREVSPEDLCVKTENREQVTVRVIQVVPDSIFTEKTTARLQVKNNIVHPDPSSDVLYLTVMERHGKNNNTTTGFIQGFGLKQGAFAQSIAHDSHNIIATGTNAPDMALCINAIRRMKGGIAVASRGNLLCCVKLPYAGLLSLKPIEETASKVRTARTTIRNLGCNIKNPITLLSFMALPVIPRLKLTDKGLFDVDEFKHVEVIMQ